ncbi:TetR/AcrR family transcriptional regulator [Rhizobium paknamense]|uniref:AcrR family transcriptional regulator n=1 Tax=Rhizobium paknamense TaxID=1206817 RepID=A0ABU0IEU2_9HYPH|nr:TetR/AcrR family transcriptional regulator [Rhizobium paknamense]MDQ0456768.1 AcrR family transcriptional regulator [Rhizobium paknamense]
MRVKTDKKRNEIIAIAGALFLEHGYGAVSMATIAAAVGGSKGTLYGYFASKEDLFAAFVIKAGEQRWEEFIALPEGPASLEQKLKILGQHYLRFLLSAEIQAVNRLVIGEAGRFPELGGIFYENGPRTVIGTLAKALQTSADAGELALEDPMDAAWQFKSLCEYRLFEESLWGFRTATGEAEIARNVDHACRIFLKIYAA